MYLAHLLNHIKQRVCGVASASQKTFPYASNSICPTGADGKHAVRCNSLLLVVLFEVGAMALNAKILCACGTCGLTLNDPIPKMSLLCACEDCRQAAAWAATKGGNAPRDVIRAVYFRSDFSDVRGLNNMRAVQLRDGGRSTRIYCKSCYACVAIDHDAYADNVFCVHIDHCSSNFDVSIEPTAAIQLCDYPGDIASMPSEQIPVFHSFRYPQELSRFRALEAVGKCFSPPPTLARGQTLRDIIAHLEPVEVLGLSQGAPVTAP